MSADDIAAIRTRESDDWDAHPRRVAVCSAAGCLSLGAAAVKTSLQDRLQGDASARVLGTGCLGLCHAGPLVRVERDGEAAALFGHATIDSAAGIVAGLAAGRLPDAGRIDPAQPFFARQQRIVTANAGRVDAERIEDYIRAGGYDALRHAVTEMAPADVVQQITLSGLRGRGGGGYPTGLKWSTVAKAKSAKKFVICNADEGDPGAFMDRSVIEGDPHRVLEGMAIAAFAVGASHGYIYVRGEYPLAINRLKTAIKQAERLQLLGNRIFDSRFDFRIDIRIGAGAFVCGEETALIASVEGRRGTPRTRPPYPAESGLWGEPTLINNVETYANVPPIVARGGAWYAGIGTEKSKGTKVFALAGAIVNTGLIEVAMGMSLREIVYDIGGGIPAAHLDLPVDYESLAGVGSIMGSGGLIIMDDRSCMVDVARFFVEFCRDESCGKCVPCRAGTVQMHRLLSRIASGAADARDLSLVEQLCELMSRTSLCGLGQTACNPVISTLRYFRDEYLAHIVEKRCPAGVCRMEA